MFDDEELDDLFGESELPDYFFEAEEGLNAPIPDIEPVELAIEAIMFFNLMELKRLRELLLRAECDLDDLFLTMKIHEAIKAYPLGLK